jgi:hypothetical protein
MMVPGVALPTGVDVTRTVARVRTLVTVATPHRGTPVASFFTGLLGQRLLQALSLTTIHLLRFGQLPIGSLRPHPYPSPLVPDCGTCQPHRSPP